MSVFDRIELPCPSCGASVAFDLVHSVNAVRRPDLRAAILDRSFQRQECPACGYTFRMEPEFTYLDVKRRQFIAVYPASRLGQWEALEAHARELFDQAFGPASDARQLGSTLAARVVFGWAGLAEKLVAAEAGIDDRTLELAKLAVMRGAGEVKVGPDREFRLLGATDELLEFGWLHSSTEDLDEAYDVPRTLLAEIEAQADQWAALRAEVAEGLFVDYRRTMFAGVPG